MKCALVFVIVFGLATIVSFWGSQTIYTGLYESGGVVVTSGEFPSKEACISWLKVAMENEQSARLGHTGWECGKNCEPPLDVRDPWTCVETYTS